MSPPPPRPDDEPPPPTRPPAGWEVVDPSRDAVRDDPLFAELVEAKPLPDLRTGPPRPEELPVAEAIDPPPRARPVAPARPRPAVPPPPPPRREEPADPPRPRVLAACGVIGCFSLGLFGALGFVAYAAVALLSGLSDPAERRAADPTATRPGPVTPTRFAQDTGKIPLPGTVDAVGRAAGGRYLLLRVPGRTELVVFDPVAGAVVHSFPLVDARAQFAGSASKLFVYRPTKSGAEVERWNLETREKELTAPKPEGLAAPDAVAAGAGVDGPLYLLTLPSNGRATVRVLDPDTLRQTAIHTLDGWRGGDRAHVRASDDGTVLGVSTKAGAQVVRFPAGRPPAAVALGGKLTPPPLATPARDGGLVFSPAGLFDPATGAPTGSPKDYAFPTAQGTDFFLTQHRRLSGSFTDEVRLHLTADPDEYVKLDGVKGPVGGTDGADADVPQDQRVHLWPAAGLAAVVGNGKTPQLELTRIDMADTLAGWLDKPYLFVGSQPPAWAARGAEWRYTPVVWKGDKSPPVEYALPVAPAGMAVRPGGDLLWTPGPDAPRTADVTLRVTAGRLHADHRFRVTVTDDPAAE